MRDLLLSYLRFNVWANTQYIEWLNGLPSEALSEKVPSSFPSIFETFLHIWDAQYIWLERLQGKPALMFPSAQFEGSWEQVTHNVLATSEELLAFVEAKPKNWITKSGNYKLLSGLEGTSTYADMLLHCVQHSTFHRGQIVTISHVLHMKEPIPRTDYIYYKRLTTES